MDADFRQHDEANVIAVELSTGKGGAVDKS
jgi:hypothetical protein